MEGGVIGKGDDARGAARGRREGRQDTHAGANHLLQEAGGRRCCNGHPEGFHQVWLITLMSCIHTDTLIYNLTRRYVHLNAHTHANT